MKLIEILNLLNTKEFEKVWIGDITDLFSIKEFLDGKDRAIHYHKYLTNEVEISKCEKESKDDCVACPCYLKPHIVLYYKKTDRCYSLILPFYEDFELFNSVLRVLHGGALK